MKTWMETVEACGSEFFHGSPILFKKGTIITPQIEGSFNADPELEEFLEAHRPSDAISRYDAVSMVINTTRDVGACGGCMDYIYEVIPIGEITHCNMYWYFKLQTERKFLKELAINYWEALPGDEDLNEYLSQSAKVIGVIEKNVKLKKMVQK